MCQSCGIQLSAGVRRNCRAFHPELAASVSVQGLGAGTELKRLLSAFGIGELQGCACADRARLMDINGADWCEANIDEIVGWLRESAAERGLPFIDAVGRLLVRRAIANARRKEAADAGRSQRQD